MPLFVVFDYIVRSTSAEGQKAMIRKVALRSLLDQSTK